MIRDNFAAFILSHGRADNMLTLNALKECGYTVMMMPSCTKVSIIGYRDFRMHHCVDWEHGVPKIISERFRK